jgi:hypothetical protein
MLCTIGSFNLADGTYSGGMALTDFRLRVDRILDVVIPLPNQLTSGKLQVGMAYLIKLYRSPDDFTNVGGTNVTGNIFIATGTTPESWSNESILVAISPKVLDRNQRKLDATFTVYRTHDNAGDAEQYLHLLDHDQNLPRSGLISFTTTGGTIRYVFNGEIVDFSLTQQTGSLTVHAYHIIGAPVAASPSGYAILLEPPITLPPFYIPSYILKEDGGKILLEH